MFFDCCCGCGDDKEAGLNDSVQYPQKPAAVQEPQEHKKMNASRVEEQRQKEELARRNEEEARELERERERVRMEAQRMEESKKEQQRDEVALQARSGQPDTAVGAAAGSGVGSGAAVLSDADREWLLQWLRENNFDAIDSKLLVKKKFEYPLHVAVMKKDEAAVKLLLAGGADPMKANSAKLTAYGLAKKTNKKECNAAILAQLPPDPAPVKKEKAPKEKKEKTSKSKKNVQLDEAEAAPANGV